MGTGKSSEPRSGGVHRCIGFPVSVVAPGGEVFVTVVDEDENVDGAQVDTTVLEVGAWFGRRGDTHAVRDRGVYGRVRNTSGLPTATGAANPGDGVLQCSEAENLEAVYVDPQDSGRHAVRQTCARSDHLGRRGRGQQLETAANWSGDALPTLYDTVVSMGHPRRTVIF